MHHYLFIIQCQGSSILENKQFILAVSLTFKLEAHSSHTTKRVHLGPHWTEILTVKEGRYEVSTGFKLTQICHQELLQMNQEIKRIWPLIWIVLALNFIDALRTVKTRQCIYIYTSCQNWQDYLTPPYKECSSQAKSTRLFFALQQCFSYQLGECLKGGLWREPHGEHKMSKRGLFYQSWSGLSRERQVSDSLACLTLPAQTNTSPLWEKGREELRLTYTHTN